MARNDEALPVKHGIGSSAVITASETGKGMFKGAGSGLLRGVLLGAVITALAPVAIAGILGASAATISLVGVLAAIPGAYFGGLVGLPTGAAIGAGRGIGKGADRINRDSAAAQMARVQEMTALAEAETAHAIQARVVERMMAPQSPPTISAYPQPDLQVNHPHHQGQGVAQGAAQSAGVHTQRHQQAQAELMGAQQGIG